jgi:AcrR family transcriptional regulator
MPIVELRESRKAPGAEDRDGAPRRRGEDSRAEIVRAAARAFMTNGYAGSSVDMVADELGCTKGRIYYQYKGKADLFFDVQREAMRMNREAVAPFVTGAGTAGERLRRMIESQLLLIMRELPFQRVLVQGVEMHLEGSTTPAQRKVLDALIRQRDEYETLFVKVIAEGVKSGEFRKVEPQLFVKVLLGSIIWFVMWFRPRKEDTAARAQKLARELAEYMLNGLSRAG